MFKRFLAFLTKQIVTDTPDELAACMECGISQCVEGKCPNRLARVATLKAMRAQRHQRP